MTVIIKIVQLLMALALLVIVHEFGHFLFARIFKTRVEKFYLFFNPWFSLFKKKIGETEYGIGWVPLGGYVKISGMIDESMDREQMKSEPQPWEFRSKPAWQRLLIMTGGVFFNFILALLIYIMIMFAWGDTYLSTENVKYGIVTDSLGHEIGLKNGDRILTVDNNYIENFHQISADIILNNRSSIQVLRDGEEVDVEFNREYIPYMLKGMGKIDARIPFDPFIIAGFSKESPSAMAGLKIEDQVLAVDDNRFTYYDEFQSHLQKNRGSAINLTVARGGDTINIPVNVTDDGFLGVLSAPVNRLELSVKSYGLLESVPAGIDRGVNQAINYLKQFRVIFSRGTKGYESLGGFMTIGNLFPGYWDWHGFWTMTALLSIILAIMNLLPIPALDGGHVMFLLYEVIAGKKPGDRFMEYAQITGMVLLLTLLLYANVNDVMRFFFR